MKSGFKRKSWLLFLSVLFFLILPMTINAGQWINPKEFYKDDLDLVRNPRDKKGLTDLEKEEIKKYGVTALELMTYLYYNQETGDKNRDAHDRWYKITAGKKVFRTDFLDRFINEYKDKKELIRIKPGDPYRL